MRSKVWGGFSPTFTQLKSGQKIRILKIIWSFGWTEESLWEDMGNKILTAKMDIGNYIVIVISPMCNVNK